MEATTETPKVRKPNKLDVILSAKIKLVDETRQTKEIIA